MRTFDLSPLYRSTVGFDRLFSMLDQPTGFEGSPRFRPDCGRVTPGKSTNATKRVLARFGDRTSHFDSRGNRILASLLSPSVR